MSIYKVKKPLYGFESIEEVELNNHDGISAVLNCIGDEEIQFALLHTYYEKGDFEIPSALKVLLDINDETKVSVYLLVVLNKDISDSTINLGAPLIFNEDNKTMAQAVIDINQGTISELLQVQER